MMNRYLINEDTFAILPLDNKYSIIYEKNKETEREHTHCCSGACADTGGCRLLAMGRHGIGFFLLGYSCVFRGGVCFGVRIYHVMECL